MNKKSFLFSLLTFCKFLMAGCNGLETTSSGIANETDSTGASSINEKVREPRYELRKINLRIKEDSDLGNMNKTADSAFIIANAVFNSPEFQQAIEKIDFKYSSNCLNGKSCKNNMKDNGQRIPGKTVLDSLFKESVVSITFDLRKKGNALGKTCPGEYAITAFYDNIMWDMRHDTIPPGYKLAVNLCHEYMHQVGYCHIYGRLNEVDGKPDKRYINDDVTYRIGWEAYYILIRWYAAGKNIPGL